MATDLAMRCNLEASEISERRRAMAELGSELGAVAVEGRRATLRFAAGTQSEVAQFVRDEGRCCSFFDFEVDERGGEVRLGVGVPEGGESILRGLVAGFVASWRVL